MVSLTPGPNEENQKKQAQAIGNVLISILVVVAVIFLITSYGKRKEKIMQEYGDYLVNQLAQDLSEDICTTLEFGKSSIINIANSISEIDVNELQENPKKYIEPLIIHSPFNNIEYIREDGMNIMNIGEPFDASNRVYYIEGIKGNTGIWNNYHPKISKEVLVNFYTPLIVDGKIKGVVTGYIEASNQISRVLKKKFFTQPVQAILYDDDGMIISSSLGIDFEPDMTLDMFLKKFGSDQKKINEYIQIMSTETSGAIKYVDAVGEGRLCIKSIPGTNWKVEVIVPASSFKAVFGKDIQYSIQIIFIVSLVLVLYLIYLMIIKAKETRQIRKENSDLELENQKYNDETQKTYAELSKVNERLEAAIIEQKKNLSIVGSLSRAYLCIYYINLETEKFVEISPTDISEVKNHIGNSGNAREKFKEMSKYLVAPEYEEETLNFTELTTVAERLKNCNTLEYVFMGIPEVGWCRGEFVASGRDAEGKCTHVLWAIRSINEQKTLEEKKNNEIMSQLNLVNTLSQDYLNVYIVNPDENTVKILKLNGYVTEGITSEIQEYPYDALCQKYINDRVYSEDVEMMEKAMSVKNLLEKLENDLQYVGTYRVIDQNEIHYYQYKYVKIVGTNKIIAGFQNVDAMILEEKEQQDQLKEALLAAQKANEAKSTFLSNMSHDIRTPMNAIIGYSDMIRKNVEKPEKVLDFQKKLHDSSELLLEIINNVLDMARIESGKIILDETYLHVRGFLKGIIEIFSPVIKEKNLKVECIENVQHEDLLLDKVKVRELLTNLISNAVKYTPENGSITCSVTELPSDRDGYAYLEVIIADTGIGMSEEFLPTLFDSFSRERNTTTGKVAGAGLGMSIVKALVDLMGATIKAESKVGEGTKFTLHFYHKIADEINYTEKEKSSDNSVPSFNGKRVLLAEDNDLNTEIATAILEEAGFEVEHASDGEICVDMIEKAEAGYYDLVLMDIMMPNMDGYTATRTIRQLSVKEKAEIPIVAMTANAFEEDKKKSLEAGMNGHVVKPINVGDLMKVLDEIVNV